jgi:uncharacterized protein (DUF362 family)
MTTKRSRLSRRDFMRLTAIGLGSLAGGRLLSACGPAATPAGSPQPASNPTVAATPTTPAAVSTATVAAGNARPELIKFFPTVPSKVIQTHHSGVWSDKTLVPGALRQMLEASITKLIGLSDAREAWAALFRPGERIAIKVNTFSNSLIWTHVPLVLEVTNSLQEAGIPAEQITIFDYRTIELSTAGYPVNTDKPGVRCTGMDSNYSQEPSEVIHKQIKLSNILKECDALINIPVLKSHMLAGITFAMKNHYGSIYYPDILHSRNMREVAALNTLPEIKDRTRLIIGDALAANLRYANSYPYWQEDWVGDSIFMSFDPVAHDTVGLQLLTRELEKIGGNPASLIGMATPALEYAVELGLGTNDPANMEVIEQTLA